MESNNQKLTKLKQLEKRLEEFLKENLQAQEDLIKEKERHTQAKIELELIQEGIIVSSSSLKNGISNNLKSVRSIINS